MLNLRFTTQFKKDYKLAQKRNIDLSEFEGIIAIFICTPI